MVHPVLETGRVDYADLNARQKEGLNFAHISAILADYGFVTHRLYDDWNGADFLAQHKDGIQLKVQLKSRLWVDTKYRGKDLCICFRDRKTDRWYLFRHDDFLKWALTNLDIGTTADWVDSNDLESVSGAYSWPGIPRKVQLWLSEYEIRK
jgi:hypothetical protein